MISNNVEEALLLADRIVPLSAGPGATFGASIPVTTSRPRDRHKLNDDPRYHHDRKAVLVAPATKREFPDLEDLLALLAGHFFDVLQWFIQRIQQHFAPVCCAQQQVVKI